MPRYRTKRWRAGGIKLDHRKPILGHDARRRFLVAALDTVEDLYVVVFSDDPDRMVAEAPAVPFRDEPRVYAEPSTGFVRPNGFATRGQHPLGPVFTVL